MSSLVLWHNAIFALLLIHDLTILLCTCYKITDIVQVSILYCFPLPFVYFFLCLVAIGKTNKQANKTHLPEVRLRFGPHVVRKFELFLQKVQANLVLLCLCFKDWISVFNSFSLKSSKAGSRAKHLCSLFLFSAQQMNELKTLPPVDRGIVCRGGNGHECVTDTLWQYF